MDNINMNKFNGHEAYIISKALDLYVNAMTEEIESIEATGKTLCLQKIFSTTVKRYKNQTNL